MRSYGFSKAHPAPPDVLPTPSPSALGEGWGGGLEAVLDIFENRLRLQQRLAIRKAQYAKTLLAEPPCALRVSRALILVLPAIELDDQHAFDAAEIDEVRPDRMLAAKLHAQLMSSKAHPEPALGVGLFVTQLPRPIARESWRTHGSKL
jgi:hypothetical protein